MPIKSTVPDVAIPDLDIPSFLLERHLRNELHFPRNHPIYIDSITERTLNYDQIVEYARRFGAGLTEQWNWQKGDVLCVFSSNQLDTPLLTWGVHYALGVLSPANPSYTADELSFQLENAEAKGLVVLPDFLEVAVEAAKKANLPRNRIVVFGGKEIKGFKSYQSLFSKNLAPSTKGRISPKNDTAFLAYSSGTTGLPKGVMLSHSNIVSNVLQQYQLDGKQTSWDQDKSIAFLPFYHI